jgi:hypothetical protein
MSKNNDSRGDRRRAYVFRKGYQGEALPPGVKPVPPKGQSADIPVKTKQESGQHAK